MATYVILSRFSREAFRDPKEFKKLAEAVSAKIKSECSGVRWKDSYATLGRFDVVDIVEANDPKQIEQAAMIIRARSRCAVDGIRIDGKRFSTRSFSCNVASRRSCFCLRGSAARIFAG